MKQSDARLIAACVRSFNEIAQTYDPKTFGLYQLRGCSGFYPDPHPSRQLPTFLDLLLEGDLPNLERYEEVYRAPLGETEWVGAAVDRINRHRPGDYRGRPAGLSDVIAITENGQHRAHLFDLHSFPECPAFAQQCEDRMDREIGRATREMLRTFGSRAPALVAAATAFHTANALELEPGVRELVDRIVEREGRPTREMASACSAAMLGRMRHLFEEYFTHNAQEGF